MERSATQIHSKPVSDLRPGDVILPPARELLWMRRTARERGLGDEEALYLTVTNVRDVWMDRRGRWIVVTCDRTAAWTNGDKRLPFTFTARPATPWPVIDPDRRQGRTETASRLPQEITP